MNEPACAPGMRGKVATLRRYIEDHADDQLTLVALGKLVDASPHYLQRSFKAVMGLTPLQYQAACRVRLLKAGLRGGRNATDAIYAAGFGSSSRVYEATDAKLGMTLRQYSRGGDGVDISHALVSTPLGLLLIGATDRGVCFAQFGAAEDSLLTALRGEFPRAALHSTPAAACGLEEWANALGAYLVGASANLGIPLDVPGTPFQLLVWHYLQGIPRGSVQSYAEVARGIGRPTAARAVAGACAANRVALLIPCHRVIRGDGGLGGYRWGLERKRNMLALEREAR